MIDPELLALVRPLYEAELRDFRQQLPHKVGAVKADTARRGVLYSSITEQRIVALYRDELRARADRLWEVTKRVMAEIGFKSSDNLRQDLKDFVHKETDAQTVELAEQLFGELSSLGLGGGGLAVQDERDDARHRLSAEIDLYVAAVRARPPATADNGSSDPSRASHSTFLRRFWDHHSGEIIVGVIVTVLGGLILAIIL